MVKFFAFICALALAVSVSAAAEEILVGTNAEFPPFELTDDDNNVIGFDVDIIKAVGRAAGLKVTMRDQTFDSLVISLDVGKIQAAISGMTITKARLEKIDFSDPYYNAAQVIVVKEGIEGFTAIDSIKGKKIGVQLGTTGALMAEETMGEDDSNLRQFTKYNEVFNDLKLGRLDAIVVDLPVAQAYLKLIPGLRISSEPMSTEEYGIAVKKGNKELLNKLNAGLKAIRESGEFDEITAKWFSN